MKAGTILVICFFCSWVIFNSCKRELSCENCRESIITNQHPQANAGADQIITLPVNTVPLDGSSSTDPDNNIVSYEWTKIDGPSSFNIGNSNIVDTLVSNLIEATYQFELKVTDAGGLFSKDTMQVTVNHKSNIALVDINVRGDENGVEAKALLW